MNERQLVIIIGPTAVGKTSLCVQLAKELKTEIISADSRQFYKELEIGTAKPTVLEMDGIVHHFVNSHSISELYSAGDFERDVITLLDKLFFTHNKIILTGGSGLFVKAITHGLDNLPTVPIEIRTLYMHRLKKEGIEVLANELKQQDFDYYNKVDLNNSQRIVRALEVIHTSGRKFSDFHLENAAVRNFKIKKIGLERPREELYARINLRVDEMIAKGLVEEVQKLISFQDHNALKTVGYKEVFSFLRNEISHSEMVELIKRNTRRYAKRQLTWFKNQDEYNWFFPEDYKGIIQFINS